MILLEFLLLLFALMFVFTSIYVYGGMTYTDALYTSVMTQTLIGIPEPVSPFIKKVMILQAIFSYVLTTVVVVRHIWRVQHSSRTASSPARA